MKIFKMNIAVNYARTISLLLALLLFVISSSAHALIQRSFVNLGFEAVQISNTSPCRVYASQGSSVPGWSTTHPVYTGGGRISCAGTVSAGVDTTSIAQIMEVWKGPRFLTGGTTTCSNNSQDCINGRSGNQFVELNAESLSEIRQQVCLETGESVGWKFSHNGRNATADQMRFKAGSQSIIRVATSTTGSGNVLGCDSGTCNAVQSRRTTLFTKTRWADYSGSFTANNSTNTYIGFESLSGSSTEGNFLDDIQVTLKPAVEFKLGNYTDVENISASQSVEVQVVGIVPANINLNFSIDPTSTAVIGTDYTINNGTSTSFNIPLAAGDYSDGEVISIPVKLLNNSVVEGSRSFKVILTPDATKFTIMPTSSCTNTGGNATSTYSIQDDDIGLQLEKTWVNASVNDKATLRSTGGASGAANINYVSTASAANVSNASNSIILTAGESRTLAETLSSSNTGAYNASVWSCDGGSLSGSVLTTSTADYGKVIKCTVTNSRMTSLQLAKVWGTNSLTTDGATIGATIGGSNNTAPFTTAGGTNANSGAPVIITAGNTITFPAETGTNIATYNTVLSCTANGGATANTLSGTNGQATNTLVIGTGDAGKSIACTYTNTRKSTTFRLAKAWGANSTAGNVANLGATTGLTNNTTAFTSTASTAANGTAVTVYVGETVTLPAETMSSGTLANYTTAISCNAGTLSGTNGQSVGNTLAITAAATATNPITCTYTNTVTGADLAIDKTGSSSVTQGSTVSYTIKVWNKGPTLVSSSTFTDNVPAALTNVSWACTASGSAVCGTTSGTGNSITVTTGTLPVNNVTTAPTADSYLTFNVTGTAASVGNISNTASIAVTSGTDPVTANNSSSASTTVSTPAAISSDTPQKEARFVITPDLPTIYRGQAGTQLINITNQGPDDASSTVAVFKPRTQTGVTVTSVKIVNGANCSLSSGEWSCPVGSVANGGSFQLQVGYDTTASSTLGTAIQADIRVSSNEFNPGSGVGETLYKVWGSNSTNEIRPNGAFWAGFKGAQGATPASGYDDETTAIINAWPLTQASPTGSYLVTAVPGTNNNIYAASSTNASPMINRIISNMSTDPDRTVTLPSLASTSAGDNRRAWEFRTGVFVPQATNVTLCIGNTSVGIDDGAYIALDGQVIGTQDSYQPGGYVSATVAFTAGYHTLSYRILNQNTYGGSAEVAQGLYGAIGILYNGSCNVAGYDAWVNTQIPASITIIEKQVVTITGQVFEDNGASTGISNAYDGTKQAGELGIAGSTVTINNCTNTTAIATTQTNANGEYTFSLLPTDLPADNFCIAQQNLDGYSSVSGTAGYTRATDTITVPKTPAVTYPDHNFGDARLNAVLTEDGQQTIIAGGVADYPHRLTAQSVLTVTSLNQTNTQQPANSTDAPWQSLLYLDTDCNGKVDAGENLISASLQLSLEANEQVCLVQRVYAPANASMGAQHIGQLQASFNVSLANPTETITGSSIKRQDTTLLGSAGLSMQKMVRSVESCPSTAEDTGAFATTNTAQSGGYLEYEITYRNNSLKNLIDISIKDTVPVGTVFKNINCQVSPAGTCTESKTGDALLWQTSGTLLPNQQGKVRFCVQIP